MPFVSNTTTPLDRSIDTSRRSGYSKLFKQSVPRFILEEYPLFIDFLEAYYEWLDQHGNPIEFLQNGTKYFDIDKTSEEFLQHFKSVYLDGFPKNLEVHDETVLDERTLIKNIREFYKIKGNEKSIQLLFKIVADTDSSIEYPREYIFNISSGNYRNYYQIYVLKDYSNISLGFDLTNVKGLQLHQYEGFTNLIASATIDSIHEISSNGKEYYVITVNNPSGTFIESDFSPIQLTQNGIEFKFYPVPNVSSLEIINGGTGYAVGDFFTVGNTGQEHIKGFIYQTDQEGTITKVKIFKNPVNYNGSDTLRIDSPFGTGANFSVTTSVITDVIQEYQDNKNLLSRVSKIQDSFEYQQFSYVVKSKRSFEDYIDAIKNVIHPSGFVIFNSLYNNIFTERPTEYKTRILAYERTSIGSYASYFPGSNTGYGSLTPWNPTFPGDPNQRKTWGKVFSFWPGKTNVNPNALPNCCTGAYETGDFAPNITYLANPSESQFSGITHWITYPHPAVRGMATVPIGSTFGGIKLQEVLRMPVPIIS
jgi:hypothetical protein